LSGEEAALALKGSSKMLITKKKKRTSLHKLSKAEIEARLVLRAKEIQDSVLRLEQSQIVTQDTMHLEFKL
jgi:hypothetical protein